jgi:NADH-quinone oxidoreductase subunit C
VTSAEAGTRIRERFGVDAVDASGALSVLLGRAQWLDFAAFARRDLGCLYFNWLTAVDWKEQGLEVLCRVEDLSGHLAVLMRTRVPTGDAHCPTLTTIYRGADWMERECYDLLGVVFDGHPDLRRILLGDDWEGHPLRKDYAHDMPHAPYR